VHALVLWFDTLFSQRFCAERPVTLSTSPLAPPTHWAQTVLLLRAPLRWAPRAAAGPGDAVALTGQLSMSRSRQTHRSLDIVLRYTPRYADGTSGEEQVVLYGMGVEA
jgi:protein arginine N-methyltransferase 3